MLVSKLGKERMSKPTEHDVRVVLDKIVKLPNHGTIEYAKAYARYGLLQSGEDLRVQCLYVLSNLQYWRGEEARNSKAILKKFST